MNKDEAWAELEAWCGVALRENCNRAKDESRLIGIVTAIAAACVAEAEEPLLDRALIAEMALADAEAVPADPAERALGALGEKHERLRALAAEACNGSPEGFRAHVERHGRASGWSRCVWCKLAALALLKGEGHDEG